VPVILAIGMREVEERTATIRRLGETKTQTRPLSEIVAELRAKATPPDLR
jgi:threonyl-tRNA synthetase